MSDSFLRALERQPFEGLDLGERSALFAGLLRAGRLLAVGVDALVVVQVRLRETGPELRSHNGRTGRRVRGRARAPKADMGDWWTPTGGEVWWWANEARAAFKPLVSLTPVSVGGVVWLSKAYTLPFNGEAELVEYLAARVVALQYGRKPLTVKAPK